MTTVWMVFGVVSAFVVGYGIYAFVGGSDKKTNSPYLVKWLTSSGSVFIDILRGLLIVGAPGSGKSKSGFRPIFKHAAENRVSFISHDYKDFELVEMAHYYCSKSDIPSYYISPGRIDYSSHINPIEPKYIERFEDINKIAADFMGNLSSMDSGGDNKVFIEGGEAAFAAIAWRLKEDYPQFCSIPYVASIIMTMDFPQVVEFIQRSPYASLLGKPYLEAASNVKLMGSVQYALSGAMRKIVGPELFEIFSKSDFDLNINAPGKEAFVSLVNHPKYDFIYTPFLSTVARCAINQMSERNQNPAFLLVDEASKFKLAGMEGIPALLRSYGIATVIGFQDKVQGVRVYSENILKEIVANLGSKIIGKTNDPDTARWYEQLFELVQQKQVSISRSTGMGAKQDARESISQREVAKHRAFEFNKLNPGEFFVFDDKGNNKRVKFKEEHYEPMMPKPLHNYSKTELELRFKNILEQAKNLQ